MITSTRHSDQASPLLAAPFIYQGILATDYQIEHLSRDLGGAFTTPSLDLRQIARLRAEASPAAKLKVAKIIDFLVAVGEGLTSDNRHIIQALAAAPTVHSLPASVLKRCYLAMRECFSREALEITVEADVGVEALDGWKSVRGPDGRKSYVRACPPRLVHVLAGNAPIVAATTIAMGALTKGVHLLKMPSNDLFSATAILRTMIDIDPHHPVLKSFSAVYWKGGDETVERVLYRPQYFDKIVVWGGEKAVRHAQKYVGPGLQLVSWDPKTSYSMIGREAFASEETLREVVVRAATDATILNQDACSASRYQFVEGDLADVDRYCEMLVGELGVERAFCGDRSPPTPIDIRAEIEALRHLEPDYRVWGSFSGTGLVIRSDEPLELFPDCRTVNVVRVDSLDLAVPYANVATQTVGIYPSSRKPALRDRLADFGVQRVVCLGEAINAPPGVPHDGCYEMNRLVRWVADEGSAIRAS